MCYVASSVRLFTTLWTAACQAPLSIGFSGQEYWSGLPCPPPGDLPDPETETMSLMSPALAGGFFITGTTWETHLSQWVLIKCEACKQRQRESCSHSNHLLLSTEFGKRLSWQALIPGSKWFSTLPLLIFPFFNWVPCKVGNSILGVSPKTNGMGHYKSF